MLLDLWFHHHATRPPAQSSNPIPRGGKRRTLTSAPLQDEARRRKPRTDGEELLLTVLRH